MNASVLNKMQIDVKRSTELTMYSFVVESSTFQVFINAYGELTWKFCGKFPYTSEAIEYVINSEKNFFYNLFSFVPYNAYFMIDVMRKNNFRKIPNNSRLKRHLWQLRNNS